MSLENTGRLLDLFFRCFPVLLPAYMAFSLWIAFLVATIIAGTAEGWFFVRLGVNALAWGMFSVASLLAGLFFANFLTGWYYTWFHAPFYMADGRMKLPVLARLLVLVAPFIPAAARWIDRWKRTDEHVLPPQRWHQAHYRHIPDIPAGQTGMISTSRPNYCQRQLRAECNNAALSRRDRYYHAHYPNCFTLVDSCLPVWDHWCYWLGIAVYLHTIKVYLWTIIWMLAYNLFILGFFIYAALQYDLRFVLFYTVPISAIAFLLILFLGAGTLRNKLYALVRDNKTLYEHNRPGIFIMAKPFEGGRYLVERCESSPLCEINPWVQGGWKRGWSHTMGTWFDCLNPFSLPARVHRYDDASDFCEEFGPAFKAWVRTMAPVVQAVSRSGPTALAPAHLARNRRNAGRSSGYDPPMDTGSSRRHGFDGDV